MRDVADSRFEKMTQKVNNMKYEVYNMVMETEMEMTGLHKENLKGVGISMSADKLQNKSLLGKMNTLKKQILTKKYGDNIPADLYNSDSGMDEEDENAES